MLSSEEIESKLKETLRNLEVIYEWIEVDPELEITEIVRRVISNGGPALLFEKVKGSRYPLAINLLGSMDRIEMALGKHPGEIGRDLLETLERMKSPSDSLLLGRPR